MPATSVANNIEAKGDIIGWFASGSPIEVRTRTVFDDEPCYYLGEFNFPAPNGKRKNRYQILRVVRNDRLVTARILLGASTNFKADQFQIPGGEVGPDGRGRVWHTVAELREIADRLRDEPPRREQEPSDLQTAFRNYVEEKSRRQRHISTFGAGVHLQR